MLNLARKNAFYIFFLVAIAVLYLPKMFLADSAFYTSSWVEKVLPYVGSLSRLLFLLVHIRLRNRVDDNCLCPPYGADSGCHNSRETTAPFRPSRLQTWTKCPKKHVANASTAPQRTLRDAENSIQGM